MKATIQLNFLPEVLKNFDINFFDDGQYGPIVSREHAKSQNDHWSFVNCAGVSWGNQIWNGYVGTMGSDIQWTTCRGNMVRVQRKSGSAATLSLEGTRGGCLSALDKVLTTEEIGRALESIVLHYETTDTRLTWYQVASSVEMAPEMAAKFVREGKRLSENWMQVLRTCKGKSPAWVSASYDPGTLKVVLAKRLADEKEAARMADYCS